MEYIRAASAIETATVAALEAAADAAKLAHTAEAVVSMTKAKKKKAKVRAQQQQAALKMQARMMQTLEDKLEAAKSSGPCAMTRNATHSHVQCDHA